MIERYTIKFGPVVSQKELEKALNEDLNLHDPNKLSLLKARVEVIGSFEDLKKIRDFIVALSERGLPA